MSPAHLAEVTADDAFMQAGVGIEGLTLDQFRAWSSQSENEVKPSVENDTATNLFPAEQIQYLREISGLANFQVGDILELIAEVTDDHGFVSRANFDDCAENILAEAQDDIESISDSQGIWVKLYNLFDPNGDNQVDFTELATGLSVLCGSPSDENVAAAFSLYDLDNRGVISFDDMTRYLTCVFRVFYGIHVSLGKALEASPEELAVATATKAFEDAGRDRDGELTCDEFRQWYSGGGNMMPLNSSELVQNLTVQDVQDLTNLGNKSINDVYTALDSVSDDGKVVSFEQCRHGLLQLRETVLSNADSEKFESVVDKLFARFLDIHADEADPRKAHILDICAGLSVLCSGDGLAKSAVAFQLFDTNKDGRLSREEMKRYLTAVFSVMYELQPGRSMHFLFLRCCVSL